MPITTFKEEVVDVSFIFPLQNYYLSNPNATDVSRNDGLKLKNTDANTTDVSYVGILMHGNVLDLNSRLKLRVAGSWRHRRQCCK